jgi:excisionase family DNA binding protein
VLSVKAVAARLACSQATVYSLIASKRLRHFRIGTTGRGAIRVSEEQIAEFLSGAESGAGAAPARPVKLKHLQL